MFPVLIFAVVPLLLANGPPRVHAFSFAPSQVQQCGQLKISFKGTPRIDDLPLSLTVVPFDSTLPLSVPIPNAAIQNGGVSISFLPYAAGTSLVVSIDNAANTTDAKVSKPFQVMPSPTGNSSCLPESTTSSRYYTLPSSLSQCEPFNITYNPSIDAPMIRIFKPDGPSALLNVTGKPAPGVATYQMCASYASKVVLLLDDQNGHRETTAMIDVGGDSNSNKSCLPPSFLAEPSSRASRSPSLSRPGAVAIVAVTASIVMTMALLVAGYAFYERRRRRSLPIQIHGDYSDRGNSPTPRRPSRSGIPSLFSARPSPPYLSPKAPLWPRDEHEWISSGSKVAAVPLERRYSSLSVDSRISEKNAWDTLALPSLAKLGNDRRPASLTSVDIEDILNSATIYTSKENEGWSDTASIAYRTVRLSADQSFVVKNPPPRRYTAHDEKSDRWNTAPDVPTDPPQRFSQVTDLEAVIPQRPPGSLNPHMRALSLPQSRSRRMLYPNRLSTVLATPAPGARLSTGDTPISPGASPSLDKEQTTVPETGNSRSLGGVLQSRWYAI